MGGPIQPARPQTLVLQENDLYAMIGKLQVENLLWKQRVAALEAQLAESCPAQEPTVPLDAQLAEAVSNGPKDKKGT